MTRKLFSAGILLIVLFWLIANYLPQSVLLLPTISWDWLLGDRTFLILFVVTMLLAIGLQLALLQRTNRIFLESKQTPEQSERVRAFGLEKRTELIWTAVPILMTVAIFVFSITVFIK